jgi:hypothetical protein
MTAKTVEKKPKKINLKPVAKTVKINIKKTRCEETVEAIIKMTKKCEKSSEQIEFYTFTALDQCLKRLTGFCPPN